MDHRKVLNRIQYNIQFHMNWNGPNDDTTDGWISNGTNNEFFFLSPETENSKVKSYKRPNEKNGTIKKTMPISFQQYQANKIISTQSTAHGWGVRGTPQISQSPKRFVQITKELKNDSPSDSIIFDLDNISNDASSSDSPFNQVSDLSDNSSSHDLAQPKKNRFKGLLSSKDNVNDKFNDARYLTNNQNLVQPRRRGADGVPISARGELKQYSPIREPKKERNLKFIYEYSSEDDFHEDEFNSPPPLKASENLDSSDSSIGNDNINQQAIDIIDSASNIHDKNSPDPQNEAEKRLRNINKPIKPQFSNESNNHYLSDTDEDDIENIENSSQISNFHHFQISGQNSNPYKRALELWDTLFS